ncbi:hypothetical protein LWC34_02135 [Kibdelosporangium philippinense]|uniref:Uncharacterized protein n=1 Tax=Kibdelosporangium philippinense TaxID=211113 RepID=A0ABS8Z4H8_9PSEU|nr:hypothetical protein [Kibdelosporangium philippinense]
MRVELLAVGHQRAWDHERSQRIDFLRSGRDRNHGVLRVTERACLPRGEILRGVHRGRRQAMLDRQRPSAALRSPGSVAFPHSIHSGNDLLNPVATLVVSLDHLVHRGRPVGQTLSAGRAGEVVVDRLPTHEHGQPPDLIV